jgi:hypothetical protein
MNDRWTEWKPFPDPYHGEYIAAPLGPGVYEVCDASTRDQVAFGCTQKLADSLAGVLKSGKARKKSFFSRRQPLRSGALEYRTWAPGSLADAKVAVDQILGQRQAVFRRFSAAAR